MLDLLRKIGVKYVFMKDVKFCGGVLGFFCIFKRGLFCRKNYICESYIEILYLYNWNFFVNDMRIKFIEENICVYIFNLYFI